MEWLLFLPELKLEMNNKFLIIHTSCCGTTTDIYHTFKNLNENKKSNKRKIEIM